VKWIVGPPLVVTLVALAASALRIGGQPVFELPWLWALLLAGAPSALAVADLFLRPRRIEIGSGVVTVVGGPVPYVKDRFPASDVREIAFAVGHGIRARVGPEWRGLAVVPLTDQRWLAAELRRLVHRAASA
jgi:hypothetical protein